MRFSNFPSLALFGAGLLLTASACNKDDDELATPAGSLGAFEVEFDNVIGEGAELRQLELNVQGDTDYGYTSPMGQDFNVTYLRYFVSDLLLKGAEGTADYQVPMRTSVDLAEGFFLIREEDAASQLVRLDSVPTGRYNGLSFTVGIDSSAVSEGATGGILDPVRNEMFWSWNSGYVALKLEGQSQASPGKAFGNSIDTTAEHGFVYHVGGWKERDGGKLLVVNNRRVDLDFSDDALVGDTGENPHVHLYFDVEKLLGATQEVDFSKANSVHSPALSRDLGLPDNMARAFRYDHIHQ